LPLSSISQKIIEESRSETIHLINFVKKKFDSDNSTKVWLIGGWAVDAYNSWYGSRDIDIMASTKVVSELKKYLYFERGYKKYRGVDGIMRYYKEVGKEEIEIDFVKSVQSFQGTNDIMTIKISQENSVNLVMNSNATVIVPDRSILLGMKVKAAWDRRNMLENGRYRDRQYLIDKITKDYGDIIALLDDRYIKNRPLNLQYLHDEIFSKDYLRDLLKSLTLQDLHEFQYRSLSPKECREMIARLLSIV
jgi:predicted nucleotidyltransferase